MLTVAVIVSIWHSTLGILFRANLMQYLVLYFCFSKLGTLDRQNVDTDFGERTLVLYLDLGFAEEFV